MRIVSGTVAVVLAVVMVSLFYGGPKLTFADSGLTVECGSVADAGWPDDTFLDTENVPHLVDKIPSGVDGSAEEGMLRDCDHRRTGYTGLLALLAVPTAVFAALAVVLPRKRRPQPRLREEALRDKE